MAASFFENVVFHEPGQPITAIFLYGNISFPLLSNKIKALAYARA